MTPLCRRLFLVALIGLAGCYEQRIKHDGWETFRSQLGADPPGGAPQKADRTRDVSADIAAKTGWAILIETFEGNTRYRKAGELIRKLTNRNAVTDLWLQENDGRTKVYRGRYDSLTDLEAQKALLQTRAIEDNGERPYENVELVSLGDGNRAVATSGDLRAYTGQGFYTLQIGFYDADFGPDFRDAAEQAATVIRNEGYRAFYYHGPNRSLVTVELFTDADFDQDGPVRVYGARMLALQDKYKFNLCNGNSILESFRDGKKTEKREQPSFIVRVP